MGLIVTYGGTCLSELYHVADISRPAPAVTLNELSVPGRQGSVVQSADVGAPRVKFTLWRLGVARGRQMSVVREIAAIFKAGEEQPLSFSDEGGLYRMAQPSGTREPIHLTDAVGVPIELACADAVLYGATRSVEVPSGGSAEFSVGGTAPALPRVECERAVRGSGDVWGVRLDGGDFIHVATGSAAARAVAIDCSARVCRVSGAAALPTLDSDWLELQPGGHVIENDQGSGACRVEWTERWL